MILLVNRKLLLIVIFLTWSLTDGFLTDFFFRNMITFHENEECQYPKNNTKYAIIIHGWKQSCENSWVEDLEENLSDFRGGCIMCMDYRFYSNWPHYFLLAKFSKRIAKVVLKKLQDLEAKGFNPNNGFMFGFSLGGRIALQAGRMYGIQKIAEIDTCDMAGPGFDKFDQPDPKESAQNVQCIHTSNDKGTNKRNCHQNWLMGLCGMAQDAAHIPPLGSHGLCPVFYNSAFENNFYAEAQPTQCSRVGKIKPFWPKKFKMGYMEKRKSGTMGTFYAATSRKYPYTRLITYGRSFESSNKKDIVFLLDGKKFYGS